MLRLRFGSIVISIVNRQVSNNGSQMLNATSTPELSLLFKRWQSIGDPLAQRFGFSPSTQ